MPNLPVSSWTTLTARRRLRSRFVIPAALIVGMPHHVHAQGGIAFQEFGNLVECRARLRLDRIFVRVEVDTVQHDFPRVANCGFHFVGIYKSHALLERVGRDHNDLSSARPLVT